MFFHHHYHHILDNAFLGLSGDAWAAIATFVAVLVALFQERIKDFFRLAKLKIEIRLTPPDSHKIVLVAKGEGAIPVVYIRIRVTNVGKKVAEGVEIMITNFLAFEKDGRKKSLSTFLPLNLRWSHFEIPTQNVRIPPGLFRFCDFGSIRPVKESSDGDKCVLLLDTMVQPYPVADGVVPNMFGPERYEFETTLTGDNVRPLKQRWSLEFVNEWSTNEETMLKNIRIKELS